MSRFTRKILTRKGLFFWKDSWNHDHQQWQTHHALNQAQMLTVLDNNVLEGLCHISPKDIFLEVVTWFKPILESREIGDVGRKPFYIYVTTNLLNGNGIVPISNKR